MNKSREQVARLTQPEKDAIQATSSILEEHALFFTTHQTQKARQANLAGFPALQEIEEIKDPKTLQMKEHLKVPNLYNLLFCRKLSKQLVSIQKRWMDTMQFSYGK